MNRIGSLVYSTAQGLGILAKSFWDAGVLTDVLVIRHGRRPEHDDWFPGQERIADLKRDHAKIMDFCRSMDRMLFFETPFVWETIPACREAKVKTFLVPMHECMPKQLPWQPDGFICPSKLDLQWAINSRGMKDAQQSASGLTTFHSDDQTAVFLPVPAPQIKWRKRERAEVFVHNAGHGGLNGRNGTDELLAACKHIKSPATLVVRSQSCKVPASGLPCLNYGSFSYHAGTVAHENLFSEGDVFVFPEKFNGLSLPLQEAHAAGMMVMCGDRFPMNTWLPKEPLIKVTGYTTNRVSPRCVDYQEAIVSPRDIAAKIDEWYGRDISEFSEAGRRWAEENSWEKLKPLWMEALA